MNTGYHSTFTPSESDRETLEFLFVAREDLARGIMEGILDSATSGNKHQRLLIGPRGIGKTHFVALIYHRVLANKELREQLRIAWLREDPYVASYADLLVEILRKLAQAYSLPDVMQQVERILDLPASEEKGGALEQLLRQALGAKTLLFIAENFDDLLSDLREDGQQKLRAFIQNYRSVTILATATSLAEAVAEREKAFYGFFRISPLEPLRIEQAVELLARLAERAGDAELLGAIRSPLGFARVQAIHYLAGGNPRIYVLFYDFLTRESLDDLVRPFMKLVDELTPYYQARMSRLAPLQRRIIDVLRRLRGASTVTEIARETMTSPQSISTQIGRLKELGYIAQTDSLGRSNYYEMREPLMRLVLEVKEQQGRNVELFVQFLRVWYSEPELDRLTSIGAAGLESAYLYEAAQRARSEQDPLQVSLSTEFFKQQNAGNFDEALKTIEVAIERAPSLKENWVRKAHCLAALNRGPEERRACWERIAAIDPEDWLAWSYQDLVLRELGRYEDALHASQRAVELNPEDAILNRNYGELLDRMGRVGEARVYFEMALSLAGEPTTAIEWDDRGNLLRMLDRKDEALVAFRKALELDPHQIKAWGHLFGRLQEQGWLRLCQSTSLHTATLFLEEALLQSYLGTAYANLGRYEDSLAAYERALKLDPSLDEKGEPAFLYRVWILQYLGRDKKALEALERYKPSHPWLQFWHNLLHACVLMSLGHWEDGQSALDRLLERYQPPLWTGRNLGLFVSAPLERTSAPELWQRFITIAINAFGHHRRLGELGQGLVHSLRLLHSGISDQAARVWYGTWQKLAGDIDEMSLPLRLLKAGIEYRATRDRTILLGLAREERGLLEPWLINLFEEEPAELKQEMETLLRKVELYLAKEAEAERAAAFWESPAPDVKDIDFAHLLRNYGDHLPSRPSRLLPGTWQSLSRSEARALMRNAAIHADQGALAWSRPELQVLGIDRRSLSFSRWSLFQIHVREGDRSGALDLLASKRQAVFLDGRSQILHALVKDETIRLGTDEARSEFTRFFSSTLRGAEGRYQIVDPTDLQLVTGTELPAEMSIQPWQSVASADDSGPMYSGTVFYARALFKATFRLISSEQGFVEVLDDEPLFANLACYSESFDGPIRFVESDSSCATMGRSAVPHGSVTS